MARLKEAYKNDMVPKLKQQLELANIMEVPRLTKITLNMGVGEAVVNKKVLENAVTDLTLISGQKPVINKARKSIAGFKIRQGWPIGTKVTLRSDRMYEFLERLVSVLYPAFVTFEALVPSSLMVEVTSLWV
jgi:large subunit ribosomal protein L5